MVEAGRCINHLRPQFDEIYDTCIVGGGFFEADQYYRFEKERYWRSLELFCALNVTAPASILEIGGGQFALLRKKLFGDNCMVADLTQKFIEPLQKSGIDLFTYNLMDPKTSKFGVNFDVVVLLEVIEHIPLPAHVVIENIKPLLKPTGILFMTTRNLFRLRNLIRMFLGIEFLDHFTLPASPEHGLGHQLEYSAEHLRWQLERARMEILMLKEDSLGRTGHTVKARFARKLLAPLELRSKWRDGLVAAARIAATAATK